MEKLSWSALEYEERSRDADWFWALGIIVVTGTLASLIYGNYFFAGLLLLSGVLLGYFATKKPDIVTFELNEAGLQVHNRLYPYQNIKSFWIQETNETLGLRPKLFIKSERVFMPIIAVPIDEIFAPEIYEIFTDRNIPEEEMKEHLSEKITEYFGF